MDGRDQAQTHRSVGHQDGAAGVGRHEVAQGEGEVAVAHEDLKFSKPDIVEIMPAIVTKKIREFSSLVDVPVIAGGLIENEEEIRDALEAGASVVSTGETALWSLNN